MNKVIKFCSSVCTNVKNTAAATWNWVVAKVSFGWTRLTSKVAAGWNWLTGLFGRKGNSEVSQDTVTGADAAEAAPEAATAA